MPTIFENCPNCGQVTGRQPGENDKIGTCPHCKGKFCPECVKGTGRRDDGQNVRCPHCRGYISLYGLGD